MTQKRVKASDVIGNSYYIYTLQSSNNTPSLNGTITITCNVTDVYGRAVSGKSITLYQNNTSKGAKTTDSNGNAGWNSISMSSAGLQVFRVENSKIEVFVDNKSDVGHTHSQYLTEHQSLSNYVTTDDSRLSDSRTPTSHTHGNLQNNGQVGSTAQANKNVVTNSSGLITTEDKPTVPSASSTTPSADTTNGSVGTGTTWARSNHTHPKSSLYAEATHNHTKSQITDFPSIPSKTSDLQNDSGFLTSHQSLSGYLQTSDVKDNLTSTDIDKPLSAKQGKELKTLVDGKADSGHTHSQYLTEHQSLADYVTTSDSRLSDSRTPTAHATSATTYGVSSASNYGHAMASSTSPKANGTAAVGSETAKFARGDHVHPHSCVNNLTSTSTTTPLAANQGKVLNDNKVDKNDFNVDYVHSFTYNSSTEQYGYQGQSGALGIGVSAIDINDNSLLNEDGVAIIDLVFQNTNINYGSIQLVLAEADGSSYPDSSRLSNTQTIATITDTNKHHITIVVSPDTHIVEQSYDYYDLKVSKISYDSSNITISSGKTRMKEVGVYLVFNGAIGGNIEYMNVVKRTPIVNQIIDMIYPIGSTYISVNSVNPSFLFGGEWEQIQDRFLLASGSTYSAGSTGGSADATLVSHQHGTNISGEYFVTSENSDANNTRVTYSTSGNRYVDGMTANTTPFHHRVGTGYVGVSATGKNMPPYLAVYVWKRIA